MASDPVGVYGAALATLLAVIRVLEWAQNRPRVIVQWGTSLLPSSPRDALRPAIAFQAHNFGARPTTITNFFHIVPRKKNGIPAKGTVIGQPLPGSPILHVVPPFPARLEPGGIVTAYWDLKHMDESEVAAPYALVGFRDARGRAYYCVGGLRGWWQRRQANRP